MKTYSRLYRVHAHAFISRIRILYCRFCLFFFSHFREHCSSVSLSDTQVKKTIHGRTTNTYPPLIIRL